ncbi:DUF2868 domain-containing protein [Marinobacter litoralis]|uniref:DUF2868 domain-containing protein n=1 Tax=Marinobacter litoralis TaxID=187981 RepID=UPI0018EC1D5E|nr:DUF2868 domain-containing protein [Marinobacter litoralis]MBJ6136281.1 DUF2868 domain-containing protein [Marinobacter litoralis]
MSQNTLRLLLDVDSRFQRDRDQSPAFLHRRDRRFALDCEQQGISPTPERWLDHMRRLSGPGSEQQTGRKVQQQWQRINHGFAAAGAVFGALTMAGLLFYDGGQRINITVFLAFVVLQLLLALATTAQSLMGWQPWRWLVKRLDLQAPESALAPLQPTLMARAGHTGGVAFALTGLLTLLVLLVIQDLAFGWSTTLDTAAGSYHRLIQTIAAPWSMLWPAAVPSLELVEATRFFRAAPIRQAVAPEQWGNWWPFVVMLWVTWVMLPRLLLLGFSHWFTARKARQLLHDHPGMQALLYRMETPTLDTGNQHNDASDLPDVRTQACTNELCDTRYLVCWAGAGEPELPQQLTLQDSQILKAGGRASLAEDDHVLATLAKALSQETSPAVILITRSWEPPTGELHDFLEQAHEQWSAGTRVMILPLANDANQPPKHSLIQPWLRFTERLPEGFASVARLPASPDTLYQAPGASAL